MKLGVIALFKVKNGGGRKQDKPRDHEGVERGLPLLETPQFLTVKKVKAEFHFINRLT